MKYFYLFFCVIPTYLFAGNLPKDTVLTHYLEQTEKYSLSSLDSFLNKKAITLTQPNDFYYPLLKFVCFKQKNEWDSCAVYAKIIENNLSKKENIAWKMAFLAQQADAFSNENKHDKALLCYQKQYDLGEQWKDTFALAETCRMMGLAHYQLHQKEPAFEYLNKAIKWLGNRKENELLAQIYHQMGAMYIEQNAFNKAETHLLKAIQYYEKSKLNNKSRHIIAYRLLALNMQNQMRLDKAEMYFEKALSLAYANKSESIKAQALTRISVLLYYSGFLIEYKPSETARGLRMIDEAVETQAKNGYEDDNESVFFIAAGQYAKGKEYKKAFTLQKAADSIHRKTFNNELAKSAAKVEAAFQNGQLKKQNEVLEKENELKNLRIKFIIILLLAIVLVAFLVFYANKKISNRNKP